MGKVCRTKGPAPDRGRLTGQKHPEKASSRDSPRPASLNSGTPSHPLIHGVSFPGSTVTSSSRTQCGVQVTSPRQAQKPQVYQTYLGKYTLCPSIHNQLLPLSPLGSLASWHDQTLPLGWGGGPLPCAGTLTASRPRSVRGAALLDRSSENPNGNVLRELHASYITSINDFVLNKSYLPHLSTGKDVQ